METYAQIKTPEDYKFSKSIAADSYFHYNFGDLPFAASVFVFPAERGVITDWYVSARRKIDDPQPFLVLKLTLSIQEMDQWIVEGKINQIWDNYLLDLAFGSAMVAAPLDGDFLSSNLAKQMKADFLEFHLYAHDRFEELLGETKITKVEKTARWHLLLQSFGVKQTHQIIASYEASLADPLDGSPKTVNTATINQRLQVARKQGLLSQPTAHLNERGNGRQKTKGKDNNENSRRN